MSPRSHNIVLKRHQEPSPACGACPEPVSGHIVRRAYQRARATVRRNEIGTSLGLTIRPTRRPAPLHAESSLIHSTTRESHSPAENCGLASEATPNWRSRAGWRSGHARSNRRFGQRPPAGAARSRARCRRRRRDDPPRVPRLDTRYQQVPAKSQGLGSRTEMRPLTRRSRSIARGFTAA